MVVNIAVHELPQLLLCVLYMLPDGGVYGFYSVNTYVTYSYGRKIAGSGLE